MSLSTDVAVKRQLAIDGRRTFYNNVISLSYYAMFYAAKVYLASKGVIVKALHEHRQVYEMLKHQAEAGALDGELLKAYRELVIRAEDLLGMYWLERRKRGLYTYHRLSETNRPIAQESLRRAASFLKHLRLLLD